MNRCEWTNSAPLNIEYHDSEWGVPVHEDTKLFEFLLLDAFQAGLSWLTILKKRNHFRKVFEDFNFRKIASFDQVRIDELMKDPGIIRNKLKIESAVQNAKAFIAVVDEFGSFDRYIWQFVNYCTIINQWKTLKEIPTQTIEAQKMSKDLLKRGFKFVGPTICYAFMQAAGLVCDHKVDCFRYKQINYGNQ